MRFFILFLSLFFFTTGFAQKKMKYGNIPKEDLAMTTYEPDPEADAVVLDEIVDAEVVLDREFGIAINYYVHKRIKILKESGKDNDRTNITLSYYDGFSRISGIKAMTISLENGKEVKTELSKKDFHSETVSKDRKNKRFAFRNVKPGAVLEYRYTYTSGDFQTIQTHYFQDDIPVRKSKYMFTTPNFFYYDPIPHFADQNFTVNNKDRVNINLSPNRTPDPGTQYTWVAENVPAIKSEDYVPAIDDYMMKMVIQLNGVSAEVSDYGVNFARNWSELNSAIINDTYFGKRYLEGRGFNKIIKATETVRHQPFENDLEKIKAYYKYVTNTFTWNEGSGIGLYETLNYYYDKGSTGTELDGNEINMLLLVLLRNEGIPAFPVLISTRSNGKINTIYPVKEQFNHVILQVNVDDKVYYLDATDSKYPFGLLPEECLGSEGWRVSNETSYPPQWITLPKTTSSTVTSYKVNLETDGTVKGEVSTLYKGYSSVVTKSIWEEGEDYYWGDRIQEAIPEVIITDTKFKKKGGGKIQETFTFEAPQLAEAAGEIIYFNPLFKEGYQENLFKAVKRSYPIDLPYPTTEQFILNLKLPEGYEVESLPKPNKVDLLNGKGSILFMSSKLSNGDIQVVSKLKIKQTFFTPEEYEYLRQFFDKVVELHTTPLVIKKKS